MRFYLAGKFRWQKVIYTIGQKLTAHGHQVGARWLTGHDSANPSPSLQAQWAAEDLQDIDAAEAVVVFQLPCDNPEQSIGRHVEFGYALAKGKPVSLIGLQTSVFHYAAGVTHYPSLDAFYQATCKNGQLA